MYEPGIDVLVVNYRTSGDVECFLRSLLDNLPASPLTLYIYNVAPDEASLRVVDSFIHDTEGTIESHHLFDVENCGYAAAANRVGAISRRKTFAIFNADTYFLSPILDECCETLHDHADWAVLGPRQISSPSGKITHGGIVGTNSAPIQRWWSRPNGDFAATVDEVVSVSGSAYFVKRFVWDEMTANPAYRKVWPDAEGAFLPTQHYYEETFCSYHARHLGWKVGYLGTAVMVHKWHQASPVGPIEKSIMPLSRQLFRDTCDAMGIDHD